MDGDKTRDDSVSSATSAVLSHTTDFLTSLWGGQYSSLAAMMSGSIAKWVVCPIDEATNMTELDLNLGTEDAAFQEHVKEAYSKWTGYQKKVPGEECAADPVLNGILPVKGGSLPSPPVFFVNLDFIDSLSVYPSGVTKAARDGRFGHHLQ